MADYCGTADLKMVYHGYATLMGTSYDDYIDTASEWLTAEFYAHNMTPPPTDPASGTYDYYLRRACACRAVFVAADALISERTEAGDDAWWNKYGAESEQIVSDVRAGKIRLSYQSAVWQDSISPAVPWVNGTIAAPPTKVLHTSGGIGARYTSDIPRTITVEIDGTGDTLATHTYKASLAGALGSTIVQGEPCDPDGWTSIGWGVSVIWTPPLNGSLSIGQQWRIVCVPKGENVPNAGGVKSGNRVWA